MSLRVQVIGLGGQGPARSLRSLLDGRPVLARFEAPALDWLAGDFALVDAFDGLFEDGPVEGIVPSLMRRIEELAGQADECVYLVPGSGLVGDATVEALAERFDIQVQGGQLAIERPLADVQVADALSLAIAEAQYPFDAGSGAIDPARPLVVTNLRGASVLPLAARRIERALGAPIAGPDASGTLVIMPESEPGPVRSFSGLERIVATLRSPGGCPWDREQTVETLIPMMLEEIDELRDAFERGAAVERADELGDVLLHIAMIAQIAREQHDFGIEEVLEAISGKMVRRHPHVFGDVEVSTIEELYDVWQQVKDSERSGGGAGSREQVSEG
ncbi:MAG TPA: MazG nucleotide pyrophosphohydrolase domain-containing protein [Thermomicrobiales bacterium]|nr:MazG nucleotide pyrophosphohydrolase domain-containing protein [Thermomicrobiales bacterium]